MGLARTQHQPFRMRVWNATSLADFEANRTAHLKANGLPPWSTFSDTDKVKYLKGLQHGAAVDEFERLTEAVSWSLGKHPIVSYAAPISGTLLLPKYFQSGHEVHKVSRTIALIKRWPNQCYQRHFRKGDDLNMIVHSYYNERVDPRTYPGTNYVASDGILAKRHVCLIIIPTPG